MVDPERHRPPRLVTAVLDACQLPNNFVGALSALFRLKGPDLTPLSTVLWKGGGFHAFLGRLTAELARVLGLAELTLLGVNREVGAHIFHLLFSVLVG